MIALQDMKAKEEIVFNYNEGVENDPEYFYLCYDIPKPTEHRKHSVTLEW